MKTSNYLWENQFQDYEFYFTHTNRIDEYVRVKSMLVTDVGDDMCWWQVWDVGECFDYFSYLLS